MKSGPVLVVALEKDLGNQRAMNIIRGLPIELQRCLLISESLENALSQIPMFFNTSDLSASAFRLI